MKRVSVFILIVVMILMVGCARTKQATNTRQTGFLGDYYSQLQRGEAGEEILVYENPKANWTAYDKVLLDPITAWRGEKFQKEGIQEEDIQTMIDNFYGLLNAEISKDYSMLKKPESGTLRVQVAVSKLEESWATLDAISNVLPPMIVLNF
jgi:hypothetical protein